MSKLTAILKTATQLPGKRPPLLKGSERNLANRHAGASKMTSAQAIAAFPQHLIQRDKGHPDRFAVADDDTVPKMFSGALGIDPMTGKQWKPRDTAPQNR